MNVLTTPLLTGTATGAILLLAALGLTLTFGQMGVINMANGEFLMVGAYVAYMTQQVVGALGISILIALPVAFVFAGLLANVVLIRPLGFTAASVVLFVLVAHGFGSRRPLSNALIGLVLSLAAYFGFAKALGVNIGAGVIEKLIGA